MLYISVPNAAEPDVISEQVTPELEFIVLACDGERLELECVRTDSHLCL